MRLPLISDRALSSIPCEAPVVLGCNSICCFEAAGEVGHVGKSPAISHVAHRPMCMQWVFQCPSAALESPCPNETHDRGALAGKHRVSNALARIPVHLGQHKYFGSALADIGRSARADLQRHWNMRAGILFPPRHIAAREQIGFVAYR